MNCDNYKEKIMDYIDNQLNDEDKKIFEDQLKNNSELKYEFDEITELLKSLKDLPKIKANRDFMLSLNHKINDYESRQSNSIINYIKNVFSVINLTPSSNTTLAKLSLGTVSIVLISLMGYFAFNTNAINQPLMLSNSVIMNDSIEYAVKLDTTIYDSIKLIND